MELTHAYATEDDLREQLGDLAQKRLPQNMLIRALNAASRAIDNHCFGEAAGVGFYPADTATPRELETTVNDELFTLPIASTIGLVIATTGVNWATTDYRLYPLERTTGWTRIKIRALTGARRFPLNDVTTVTATWGFTTHPPEVEQACLLKATTLFSRKDAPFGVATFGDFAALRITRQDPEVLELLSTYVLDVAMVG